MRDKEHCGPAPRDRSTSFSWQRRRRHHVATHGDGGASSGGGGDGGKHRAGREVAPVVGRLRRQYASSSPPLSGESDFCGAQLPGRVIPPSRFRNNARASEVLRHNSHSISESTARSLLFSLARSFSHEGDRRVTSRELSRDRAETNCRPPVAAAKKDLSQLSVSSVSFLNRRFPVLRDCFSFRLTATSYLYDHPAHFRLKLVESTLRKNERERSRQT